MAEAAIKLMTPEEFFVWQTEREELYELVDGVPVMMLKMMTGVTVQHDAVTVNIIVSLGRQLRGGPSRPTTQNVATRTRIRSVRRPDVTVECAPLIRDRYETSAPKLVAEVLSPSTMDIDRFRKVEEYKRLASLDYILLIDTRRPAITLYRRDAARGWETLDVAGLDGAIDLPEIKARLTTAEIYEGLDFDES